MIAFNKQSLLLDGRVDIRFLSSAHEAKNISMGLIFADSLHERQRACAVNDRLITWSNHNNPR